MKIMQKKKLKRIPLNSMKKNICAKCKMRNTVKWNLFKKDKLRPRVYRTYCGLSPGTNNLEFKECEYFKQ